MAYIPGDNYCICDVCGGKFHVSQTKRRYDGALVCEPDFELRHPLDYMRGIPDHPAAAISNPEQPDRFAPQTLQDPNGIPMCDVVTGKPFQFTDPVNTSDIGIPQFVQGDNNE